MNVYTSIIHNSQKVKAMFKCPSANEWINRMWSVHTMEYCLVIKMNEVSICAMTQMTFENVMLSEISQT